MIHDHENFSNYIFRLKFDIGFLFIRKISHTLEKNHTVHAFITKTPSDRRILTGAVPFEVKG